MKKHGEMLFLEGCNIIDDEIINYVLNGLDSEYDPNVASLTTTLKS